MTKMSGPMSGTGDTKVMDWVEQQALGDGIDSIASDINKLVYQPQTSNPNGRVYDIQTLLDMCSTVDLSRIHLRIHQGALHGRFCFSRSLSLCSTSIRCLSSLITSCSGSSSILERQVCTTKVLQIWMQFLS